MVTRCSICSSFLSWSALSGMASMVHVLLLRRHSLVSLALLHHHGHDWRIFTEFQVLMFVLTATGLIVGAVVSEREATERVARESEAKLKEKEAEVAHATRFSLVSGMATALAHEINQPMAAARALGRSVQELLRSPQADFKRVDQNLTTMIAEIDLASGILRRMRDFLRRGRPQMSTINVPLMLDDTMMLIPPHADLKAPRRSISTAPTISRALHGDPIQLQQVVLNLLRNAVDSITEVRTIRWSHPSNGAAFGQLDQLEICVLDNGPGIPTDRVDHLFRPLTTSKKEGIGSRSLHLLGDCRSARRPHLASFEQAGATEFRLSLPLEAPEHS